MKKSLVAVLVAMMASVSFGAEPVDATTLKASGEVRLGSSGFTTELKDVPFAINSTNKVGSWVDFVIGDNPGKKNATQLQLYYNSGSAGIFQQKSSSLEIGIYSNGTYHTDALVINNNGNIGIGTKVKPVNYKLAVEGKIGAREVVVTQVSWADFVFEDDYKLKSLEEVEEFIEKNNHLPEIPSGKEVEKNGISVGEMQAKQMQKIEELTLYTIEQEKKIKELEEKLNKVLSKIDD